MTRHALVFGASGQIGHGLLPRLRERGVVVDAVSRSESLPPDDAWLRWHRFDLFRDGAPLPAGDLVFSLGPLDGFVRWLEQAPATPRRVIVFGSTSAMTKRESPDAHERALASHLGALEQRLQQLCGERGIEWVLLRPTLIYGLGRDRNLTRIVALARRFGLFVLPSHATGLRQPVHADDLSAAAVQAGFAGMRLNRAYDLSGGETLRYNEMVRRTLACLRPAPRLIELPRVLLRIALAVAARRGRLRDAGAGMLERMGIDLVFDHADARRDLGYAPRPFAPEPQMFGVVEEHTAMLHRNKK